jgi:coenzyme F420-reducing hydrogenase delta subunit
MFARRRLALVKNLLEFIGLEPQRFRMSWVSAAEGLKYTLVVKDLVKDLKPLGPQLKMRKMS